MSQPPTSGEPPSDQGHEPWRPPEPPAEAPTNPWSAPTPTRPAAAEPPASPWSAPTPPPPPGPSYPQPSYQQPSYPPPASPYQAPTPQYGQSQYARPQSGQIAYPTSYGQPYGTGQNQWESLPTGSQPAHGTRRGGRGRLIGALVAVVVLAGGGAATYVAVGDSSSKTGAATPEDAIRGVVADINNSDLIGVLDDLVPAERTALVQPVTDDIDALKRTNVLNGAADPKNVAGIHIGIAGLTFSGTKIPVTETVQIVEITGGTLDVSADLSKVPFTRSFLDAAFPHGLPSGSSTHQTVDIAKEVRDSGDPGRIAVQKVDGRWYPSLFYTVAYAAADGQVPAPSDYIAPHGQPTPEDAVRQFVRDLLQGDLRDVVALMSPEEMAVAHTYGGVIAKDGGYDPAPVHLDDLALTSKDINGGAKRVTLQSVTATEKDGTKTTVKVDGVCMITVSDGRTKRTCPEDGVAQMLDYADSFGIAKPTAAQRKALVDLLSGATSVGLDVSRVDGQWYVDPVRSVLDLYGELYSHLQGNDVIELVKLIRTISEH